MEAATLSFKVLASSLPNQPSSSVLFSISNARDEVFVTGEHHHHDQARYQHHVDQGQDREHYLRFRHAQGMGQDMKELLEELLRSQIQSNYTLFCA